MYTTDGSVSDIKGNKGTPNNALLPLRANNDYSMIVGMSLNGVFFFTPTFDFGYDALFPSPYGTVTDVSKRARIDQCLGSVAYNGQPNARTYMYYMYSPCIYSSVSLRSQPQPCNQYELCAQNPTWHANFYTPAVQKSIKPIGVAKDGHVIYGPYKDNGNLWEPCDVDVCNGRKFDTTHYGYVATMFFPYVVGCWGPGSATKNLQA